MHRKSRAAFTAIALSSLLFTPAAWSQGAPWAPATVPTSHSVPPPPPVSPAFDPERVVLAAPRRVVERELPEAPDTAVRPLTPGRVVGQISAGWISGVGGAFGGWLLTLPFLSSRDEGVGFAMMYGGWALATSAVVWRIGEGGRAGGGFLPTLLGATTGAFLGAAMQFWVLDEPENPLPIAVVTGTLSTAGAVIGYALSASGASDLAADERPAVARVTPSLTPTRDGVLLGASGRF